LLPEEEEGLRRYGPSKDQRPDLPQVVIGLALIKERLPRPIMAAPSVVGKRSKINREEVLPRVLFFSPPALIR